MILKGLRARLLLLLGLAVLPAVVLLIAGRINERRAAEREMRAQALNLARLTAQAHGQRIEVARQLLVALARHPDMTDPNAATCNAFVRALRNDYVDIYATIGRADMTGLVDCIALDGAGANMSIADREYFQRTKETGGFVTGDFMHGKVRRLPTLAFAYPLRDAKNGAITHVMFANVDLTVLSRELEAETRMEGTTLSLLDRNGALIARSADADRYFGVTPSNEQLKLMKEQGDVVTSFYGPDGVHRLFAISAIRDSADNIVAFATAGLPESSVAALIDPGIRSEWVTLAVLAVGLLIVAWGGSELLIRRPVRKLMTATTQLSAGDLSARTAPVGGVHELEVLAAAFNRMAGDLQERDVHLREGQRLEAVGQLAGGIAHDFNNLLTVIIGYADVLKESAAPGSPEALQLTELCAAAERASKLTQQLLAFSRRQVLLPTRLQLNDVVNEMVSLLRRTTGGDVEIGIALDPALGWVHADRVQMEQVILNLVINGRDAMPGGGRITIASNNVTDGGAQFIELSVADTGVGMDPDTRAKIFEPFFTTKGVRGTGLGLATVYGIVKQSGGDIVCESQLGAGTRFRLRLPRHEAPVPETDTERPQPVIGGSETILLVDDDNAVRTVLESVLKRKGYNVRASADATEALEWLRTGFVPDLVISDVRMPGMNGATFAREIRAGSIVPPIIFMSGDAAQLLTDEDAEGRFLQKPISSVTLLRTVRDALDGSR
jgi:signal transduction histidine kinase/CheY-like chemotaxis protein